MGARQVPIDQRTDVGERGERHHSGDDDRPGEDSDQMLEGLQGKVLVTSR
jgi:hypothetical protein